MRYDAKNPRCKLRQKHREPSELYYHYGYYYVNTSLLNVFKIRCHLSIDHFVITKKEVGTRSAFHYIAK